MTTRRHLNLLALLVLPALAGCDGNVPSDAAPSATAPESPGPPPAKVIVMTVEPGRLVETITLSGIMEPWQEVVVSTENGGTVEFLGFDKGHRVEEGQVLARINAGLARARLDEAEARLLHAEANFKKFTELVEREAAPRQDLVSATARYREAQAQVTQARIGYDRAIIEAPLTGLCVDRPVEVGEVVPPGSRLTTLQVQDPLNAVVGLPESLVPLFHEGGQAQVQVDAFPDRSFPGTIAYIAPAASTADRTFPVEVRVDRVGGLLRPGMVARVRLTKKVFENAVVLSGDVLVERTEGPVLFVVEKGQARLRHPTLLAQADNHVVIGEGLSVGETVVVGGQWELTDGAPVRIVPAE